MALRARTALLALLILAPASPARAAWPPEGLVLYGPQAAGLIGPAYYALPDGMGGALFVAGRIDGHTARRVDPAGATWQGWPVGVPAGVPAEDGAGGFFQFYATDYGALPTSDLWVRHVGGNGATAPGWPESLPVCTAPGLQKEAGAIADGAGGAFVVWTDLRSSGGGELYAQHVLASGSVDPAHPDGVRLGPLDGSLDPPQVALIRDEAGGFYAAWQANGGMGLGWRDVRVQHASAALAPLWGAEGIRLPSSPDCYAGPRLAPDGAGGCYVAWTRDAPPDADIFLERRLADSTRAPGWPEGGAKVPGLGNQTAPALAPDGFGGVFVVWSQWNLPSDHPVLALRLTEAGTIAPGWDSAGLPVTTAFLDLQTSGLAMVPDGLGGALVCFDGSQRDVPGPDYPPGVRSQRITAYGAIAPGWDPKGEVIVADHTTTSHVGPVMVSDAITGAYVAWLDRRSIVSGTVEYTVRATLIAGAGPTPIEVTLASAAAAPGEVRLEWFAAEAGWMRAGLERRRDGEGWSAVAVLEADGAGRLAYVDRDVVPGARYGYRLAMVGSDPPRFAGEAWLEVPGAELALVPPSPNPSGGEFTVRFALADAAPATLEVLDVAGRRLFAQQVGALGAGAHSLAIGRDAALAPGLYLLRLRQGAQVRIARVCVTR